MKRLVLAGLAFLAACTWSNSLYQARVLTHDAQRAERENQPGTASALWGQVITKAESAYARGSQGPRGAEALWLEGHAAARIRDCIRAVPALRGAYSAAANSPWQQQLLLELAVCEETLGEPAAASVFGTLLATTKDPLIRREARLRQGHVLAAHGEWGPALAVLAGEDTLPARLDRATALAQLGRTSEALAELEPLLAAADTSVRWINYIEIFSVRNSAATDQLLSRVLAFPTTIPARRPVFILAASNDGALAFDPVAVDRRLQQLDQPGAAAPAAHMLRLQIRLTTPATPAALRRLVDSIPEGGTGAEGFAMQHVRDLARFGRILIAKNDSTAAGSPRGDLTMFGLGEFARDSLGATRLASWFLERLERDWPRSPYVAKALMARVPLEPDSADAFRARFHALTANPYVAAAEGDGLGRVQLPRLEDSLGAFVAKLWAPRAFGAAPPPPDHR